MGILLWVVFGLIAGAIAKYLMPGNAPCGIVATIILGIIGAVVGGFLGTPLGFGNISGFDLRSVALAVDGGIVVLLIYGLVSKGRASSRWTEVREDGPSIGVVPGVTPETANHNKDWGRSVPGIPPCVPG
jgi:uncharacterized membrane protein YeaQ/YmgE (transglycosylase-associated protein family)